MLIRLPNHSEHSCYDELQAKPKSGMHGHHLSANVMHVATLNLRVGDRESASMSMVSWSHASTQRPRLLYSELLRASLSASDPPRKLRTLTLKHRALCTGAIANSLWRSWSRPYGLVGLWPSTLPFCIQWSPQQCLRDLNQHPT